MERHYHIKNIFKFDSTFFILILLVILSGMFKPFLIFLSLIIIHEVGHLTFAKIFKWKVKEIHIYPTGGVVKFDCDINKPIKEELLILIMGPVFQISGFFLYFVLYRLNIINNNFYEMVRWYNLALLIFNLLPIYPLDGGKLFNLLLYKIFNFKISNKIVILISYIFILILFIINRSYNMIILGMVLLFEVSKYLKYQDVIYNRFLLERYLKRYKFKKVKVINNLNNMYKDRCHVINFRKSYITERKYLDMVYGDRI